MRVAMYYSNSDVRLEHMPIPPIGSRELLMRVEASGICGSDVMEWYRAQKVPLVLGHEVAGVVAAVGAESSSYRVGDRIIAAHHVPCNTCLYCRDGNHTVCNTLRQTNFYPGGFAEYIRLPLLNVDRGTFLLPDHVSFEEATFVEPLACVIRGQRRAGMTLGRSVLVIGSGIAGLLHVLLARALGASLVVATDVLRYRLEAALKCGADAALLAEDDVPTYLRKINGGRLAGLVIVCTGVEGAIAQGLKCVERGGTVLLFAPTVPGASLCLSVNDIFWRNDITLTTSYAASPAEHAAALELIAAGRLNVKNMITHRLTLEETGLGFRMVVNPKEYNSIKVIIEPQI